MITKEVPWMAVIDEKYHNQPFNTIREKIIKAGFVYEVIEQFHPNDITLKKSMSTRRIDIIMLYAKDMFRDKLTVVFDDYVHYFFKNGSDATLFKLIWFNRFKDPEILRLMYPDFFLT